MTITSRDCIDLDIVYMCECVRVLVYIHIFIENEPISSSSRTRSVCIVIYVMTIDFGLCYYYTFHYTCDSFFRGDYDFGITVNGWEAGRKKGDEESEKSFRTFPFQLRTGVVQ